MEGEQKQVRNIRTLTPGVATLASKPRDVSTTEQETVALHEVSSIVIRLVQELQERLNPVLRPSQPDDESEKHIDEVLPSLPNAIRQSRYLIRGVAYQLEDMLARLDI